MNRLAIISLAQGIYWALTGLWPLVHMPSFIWVTGPKNDLWLVRTVGVLILVVGAVLVKAGLARRVTPEIIWLGVGGAAGLMFIDGYYVWQDVIWPIYLLDAVGELLLIGGWVWAGLTAQDQTKRQGM
ncbi:hypothetical protein BH24BAC1_BH24BAC1_07650 [soil metagenome]